MSGNNNNNTSTSSITSYDDDSTISIIEALLVILQIGLLLEYLPTQSIKHLLTSSTSLLAVNGISSDIIDRVMKESFQQNSMLSLCTLSTVSTLNTLPSLSLKLYDIMIMKRPEVSLTLHDLKSAFESIAQLRCCFRQDDVSVCSIKMSGEKFDDSGLNYCNWSVDTYTGYNREDEPEPEYKTTLSIRWSSSTLLNRVVVLEYNCVPSIRRRKGLRPDADAIVTEYGVPNHNLKLINVDTVLKNSNLTVCPSHCLRCNLRRCGKCYPCEDCPFCSKSVCKNCSYKYECDFCSAWCCRVCKEEDEDDNNPRSSSWQCSKCLKIKCENCQSGEEWLPTYLECCEKSLCHDCSSERKIFTCPSCLYSNCDECSNLEVSKCQKCGEIGCQNCQTAECCGKCYQALCKNVIEDLNACVVVTVYVKAVVRQVWRLPLRLLEENMFLTGTGIMMIVIWISMTSRLLIDSCLSLV